MVNRGQGLLLLRAEDVTSVDDNGGVEMEIIELSFMRVLSQPVVVDRSLDNRKRIRKVLR